VIYDPSTDNMTNDHRVVVEVLDLSLVSSYGRAMGWGRRRDNLLVAGGSIRPML